MNLFELVAKLSLDSSGFDSGVQKAEGAGSSLSSKMEGMFNKIEKAAKFFVSGVVINKAVGLVRDLASETASAGDRIDKQSQVLGMSRKAYQEWDYIMSQNGMTIDQMTTGMKTLNSTILSGIDGSEEAKDAFAQLGLSVHDLEGMSQEDQFETVIKAFQRMPAGAQKSALAVKIFGRAGMQMLPLLNNTTTSIDEMRQKAEDLGLIMSDDAIDASVAYTDSLDTMKRTFDGIKFAIGTKVLPILTKGMEKITGYAGRLSKAFKEGGFKGVLSEMVAIGKDIGQSIKNGIKKIKVGLAEWLGVETKDGDASWIDIGKGLGKKIKKGLGKIKVKFANLLGITDEKGQLKTDTNWGEIGKKLIDKIFEKFKTGGSFLMKLILGDSYVEGKSTWIDAGNKIFEWLTGAFEGKDLIGTLLQHGTEKIEGIINFASQFLGAIVDWLSNPENIQKVVNAIVDVITMLTGMIDTIVPPLIDALVAVLSSPEIWQALYNGIEGIIKKIRGGEASWFDMFGGPNKLTVNDVNRTLFETTKGMLETAPNQDEYSRIFNQYARPTLEKIFANSGYDVEEAKKAVSILSDADVSKFFKAETLEEASASMGILEEKTESATQSFDKAREEIEEIAEVLDKTSGNYDVNIHINQIGDIPTTYVPVGEGESTQRTRRPPQKLPYHNAKGLWDVPYDGYVTELHRHERVLSASQARHSDNGGFDIDSFTASIASAVKNAIENANIRSYINGRDVTDDVNRNAMMKLKARRFAT